MTTITDVGAAPSSDAVAGAVPSRPAAADLDAVRRRSPQVWLWAPIGAVSLIVVLQGWARWLASDTLTASPKGTDPFPTAGRIAFGALQAVACCLAAYFVWRFLVRPWRQNRRLSFDGMFLIAVVLAWFYDPLYNYFVPSQAWSGQLVNFGSWAEFIPGWSSPNGRLVVQPLLLTAPAYVFAMFGEAVGTCVVIDRLRVRYPRRSLLGLFGMVAMMIAAVDVVAELVLTRMQILSYVAAPSTLTVFRGTKYQFPLAEIGCITLLYLALATIRYFRDADGHSFVERGAEHIESPRTQAVVRFLAINGAVTMALLCCYHLPWTIAALKSEITADTPSYNLSGVCGPDTDVQCGIGTDEQEQP